MSMLRPDIMDEAIEDGTASFRFRVSPALEYFKGHFEGCPILPGIVQVHWAIELAQRAFGLKGEFAGIENLKFLRLVRPDVTLELRLRHEPTKGRLHFAYEGSAVKYSSGTVVIGA